MPKESSSSKTGKYKRAIKDQNFYFAVSNFVGSWLIYPFEIASYEVYSIHICKVCQTGSLILLQSKNDSRG